MKSLLIHTSSVLAAANAGLLRGGTRENPGGRSFNALWYKPHWQCDSERAAEFINSRLPWVDFAGISEYNTTEPIGNEGYGSIASSCGQDNTPIELFYNRDKWSLVDSVPPKPICRDTSIIRDDTYDFRDQFQCGTGRGGNYTLDEEHNDADCCSCNYSSDEFEKGGKGVASRPFVVGLFDSVDGGEVCVVVAELPHNIRNVDGPGFNGCTNDPSQLDECMLNHDGTSRVRGTSNLVSSVLDLCGDVPIIFMADTNIISPEISVEDIFLSTESINNPLAGLVEFSDGDSPFTCCNEDPPTRFAMDRIAVTDGPVGLQDGGGQLRIRNFEGGASVQGGTPWVPGQHGYVCESHQEHAPLVALISYSSSELMQSQSLREA